MVVFFLELVLLKTYCISKLSNQSIIVVISILNRDDGSTCSGFAASPEERPETEAGIDQVPCFFTILLIDFQSDLIFIFHFLLL